MRNYSVLVLEMFTTKDVISLSSPLATYSFIWGEKMESSCTLESVPHACFSTFYSLCRLLYNQKIARSVDV